MNVLSDVERMQIVNFNEAHNPIEVEAFELKFKEEDGKDYYKEITLIKYLISRFFNQSITEVDEILFDLIDSKYKKIVSDFVTKNEK